MLKSRRQFQIRCEGVTVISETNPVTICTVVMHEAHIGDDIEREIPDVLSGELEQRGCSVHGLCCLNVGHVV